jgi:hypothetical protein
MSAPRWSFRNALLKRFPTLPTEKVRPLVELNPTWAGAYFSMDSFADIAPSPAGVKATSTSRTAQPTHFLDIAVLKDVQRWPREAILPLFQAFLVSHIAAVFDEEGPGRMSDESFEEHFEHFRCGEMLFLAGAATLKNAEECPSSATVGSSLHTKNDGEESSSDEVVYLGHALCSLVSLQCSHSLSDMVVKDGLWLYGVVVNPRYRRCRTGSLLVFSAFGWVLNQSNTSTAQTGNPLVPFIAARTQNPFVLSLLSSATKISSEDENGILLPIQRSTHLKGATQQQQREFLVDLCQARQIPLEKVDLDRWVCPSAYPPHRVKQLNGGPTRDSSPYSSVLSEWMSCEEGDAMLLVALPSCSPSHSRCRSPSSKEGEGLPHS